MSDRLNNYFEQSNVWQDDAFEGSLGDVKSLLNPTKVKEGIEEVNEALPYALGFIAEGSRAFGEKVLEATTSYESSAESYTSILDYMENKGET